MADLTPAVRCRGLRYTFGDTVAVDSVDLDVRPGEVFGLLGPNGAGKTTTIRAVTTLLPVPRERVEVFGLDVARRKMAVRRLIGYVPQLLSADGALTGRENVSLFARLYDVPRRERAARVAEVIDAVGLADAAGRKASTYSGGMVRRLELAQALVSAPELLILDEPTTGFDPEARQEFWELIRRLAAGGTTILLTTHYLYEAEALADRVGVITGGRLLAVAPPGQLGDRENAPATVSWLGPEGPMHEKTDTPTAFVAKLAARFDGGEIPGLLVSRPTLEDVYLEMIK